MGPRRAGEHGRVVFHGTALIEDAQRDPDPSVHRPSGKREPGDGVAHDSSDGTATVGERSFGVLLVLRELHIVDSFLANVLLGRHSVIAYQL